MNYLLLCLLFVGAFAARSLDIPRPPCTWSLRWDVSINGIPSGYRLQQVNGYFMRTTSEDVNKTYLVDELFRSDLSDSESSTGMTIKIFHCSTEDENSSSVEDYLDVKSSYKLIGPLNDQLDIRTRTITYDTYYGKECLNYYDEHEEYYYYIGYDGYPIGMRSKEGTIEANATFSKDTPSLDVFAFDRSVVFDDERVYTPPTESPCPKIFVMPEVPCAWSYKWNMTLKDGTTDFQIQEINGLLARIWWSEQGVHIKEGIYRGDLAYNESGATYLKEFYHNNHGKNEIYIENYYYAREKFMPMFFYGEDPLSAEYDSVEPDTFHGKPCQKYHDIESDYYFFVDESGFPIGLRTEDGLEANGTFSREPPPLSVFTFDRSIVFVDDRIYTPPNETICPEPSQPSSSSSSSSKTSSASSKTSSSSSKTSSSSSKTSSGSSKTSSSSSKTSSTSSKTSSTSIAAGSTQTVCFIVFAMTMAVFFIIH